MLKTNKEEREKKDKIIKDTTIKKLKENKVKDKHHMEMKEEEVLCALVKLHMRIYHKDVLCKNHANKMTSKESISNLERLRE